MTQTAYYPSPSLGSANQGTPNSIGNAWPVKVTDGTHTASVSAANALKVDASGSTQPVSGTVAATQSGTWTVQPGNTANTTAWKVDGSAVTQPVSGTVAVSSIPAVTTSAATFQAEGSLAFGSITGSYQTVLTPSAATKILQLRNNTNASISVSFDAGVTLNYVLDAGDQVSLDLLSNSLAMTTTAIQIKQTSGAPTSGSFRVNACH